jgi:hypothetical protein
MRHTTNDSRLGSNDPACIGSVLCFSFGNGTLFQGVLESTLGTGGSGKVAHHVIKLCKIYGGMSQSCATPSTSSITLVYDPTIVLFSKIIDVR